MPRTYPCQSGEPAWARMPQGLCEVSVRIIKTPFRGRIAAYSTGYRSGWLVCAASSAIDFPARRFCGPADSSSLKALVRYLDVPQRLVGARTDYVMSGT